MIYVKTRDSFLTPGRVRELINYVFEKAADIDIKDHHITVEIRNEENGTSNGTYMNLDEKNHEITIMRQKKQSDADVAFVLLHEVVHMFQYITGDLKQLEYGFWLWQGSIFHNAMKHEFRNSLKSNWMPQEIDANKKALLLLKKLGRNFKGYEDAVYRNSRIYTDPMRYLYGKWTGLLYKFFNSWWNIGLLASIFATGMVIDGGITWDSAGFIFLLPMCWLTYSARKDMKPPEIGNYVHTRKQYDIYVEYFRGYEKAKEAGMVEAMEYEIENAPKVLQKMVENHPARSA